MTRDELAGSFHTPETKQQSKQWLRRGISGSIKVKVTTSRTKLMMQAFVDSKGLIYKNYMPRRTRVSANCIMEALGRFMKVFKKNRPVMSNTSVFFYWYSAPVYTAAVVQYWTAAMGLKMIRHPSYSPELAPAGFFLISDCKEGAGTPYTNAHHLQKELGGGSEDQH